MKILKLFMFIHQNKPKISSTEPISSNDVNRGGSPVSNLVRMQSLAARNQSDDLSTVSRVLKAHYQQQKASRLQANTAPMQVKIISNLNEGLQKDSKLDDKFIEYLNSSLLKATQTQQIEWDRVSGRVAACNTIFIINPLLGIKALIRNDKLSILGQQMVNCLSLATGLSYNIIKTIVLDCFKKTNIVEPENSLTNCEANDNLNDIADDFISRCRKASIRREYPTELLYETLKDIKRGNGANYKRAWKLLNDGRFKKPI